MGADEIQATVRTDVSELEAALMTREEEREAQRGR